MGRVNTTSNDDLGLKQVSSTSGFSAGDLIYETGSGIGKVPSSTVSQASFEASGELKLAGPSSSPKQAFGTVVPIHGGGWGFGSAACKLASGKIAIAYYRYHVTNSREVSANENYDCYIRIYNTDGTIDVAETYVGGAQGGDANQRYYGYTSTPVINVCQLTGGNIVVNWCGGNATGGWPCWAVLNGTTAAIITAGQADATNQNVKNTMVLEALTNGNFVIAYVANNALNVWHGLYNSTGTAISALSNIGITMSNANARGSLSVCARDDGSYSLAQMNASNGMRNYVFSGTDKSVVNYVDANSIGSTYGTAQCKDSNGDIHIYWGMVGSVKRVTLASSANQPSDMSSPTTVLLDSDLAAFGGGSGSIGHGGYCKLAAHNFSGKTQHFLYVGIRAGLDRVLFFNSDGSSAADAQTIGGVSTSGWTQQAAFVELADTVRFYTCSSGTSFQPRTPPTGLWYYNVSINGLNVGGGSGVSGSLGSSTAATGNYSESGSTAKNATFLAAAAGASQSVATRTTGSASNILSDTMITSNLYGYDVEVKIGGGFYVLTHTYSDVSVRIYDKDYNILKTKSGLFTEIANIGYAASICQLGNGKVVVAFADEGQSNGSNRIQFKIYSADLETVHVDKTSSSSQAYVQDSSGFMCCGLMNEEGDEWCIGYISSSNYAGEVSFYNDTGTKISTSYMAGSFITSYNTHNFQMCPMPNGDLCVGMALSGYNAVFWDIHRRRIDGTGWATVNIGSSSNNSYYGNYKRTWKRFSGPTGVANFGYVDPSGYLMMRDYNPCDVSIGQRSTQSQLMYNNGWGCGGVTAGGNGRFQLNAYSGQKTLYTYNPKFNDPSNTAINIYNNVRVTNGGGTNMNNQTMPVKGNEVAFFTTSNNTNFNLFMQAFRVFDDPTNIGFSNTTASAGVPLDDPSKRALFLGVAVTDCPAGGSGTIQTKGNAKVSSSYKDASTAENFNFESHSGDGKAGSQVGRSVIIRE